MKTSRFRSWLLLALFIVINVISINAQQGTWTQKANFGGAIRYDAVGFSIGSKGYIGTGNNGTYYKDFWEYDPESNTWSQKADFGGVARTSAVSFSIGTKGYIGTGYSSAYGNYYYENDLWEYDPANNTWLKRADFPGVARLSAVGFSIDTKGYIGTGSSSAGLMKDFWEFDPLSNVWSQKTNFGGLSRHSAVGFSIGAKGYIGSGNDGSNNNSYYYLDFWEYNPTNNSWSQKADIGGSRRSGAFGFSIGDKGYVGTGGNDYSTDFWEYDPTNNSWLQRADFGGTRRGSSVGFSIGSKGYAGTGQQLGYDKYRDFWEFDPCGSKPIINTQPISRIKCIGDDVVFSVNVVKSDYLTFQWKHNNIDLVGEVKDTLYLKNIKSEDSGNYICFIINQCGSIYSDSALLKVNPVLPVTASISITNSGPICSGSHVSFSTKVLNGGTLPKYNWKVNGFDVIWFLNGYSGFGSSDLANGDSVSCEVTSNATCISGDNPVSCGIKMVMDTNVVRIKISKNPSDFVCNGTNVTFNAATMNGGTNPSYQWKLNGYNVGTNNSVFSSSNLSNGDTVTCELISNASCITNNVSFSNPLLSTRYSFPPVHKSYVEISKCSNCSVELDALEGATYFWSPAEGLSATNIKNPIANPITTTTYTVQITDSNGCRCTDTTIVLVKPSFSIEAINDTTIQKGQSLILGIKPILYNVNIFFTFHDGFNPEHFIIRNSKTEKIVFWISQNENNYFFYGKGGNFESIAKIESGDYYIDELRTWSYSVTPSVGTHLNNNTFTVGGTDYTYSWMPETYLDNASIANPTATPLTDTKYIVTVNTNTGCIAKDTLNVKVINSTGLNIQKATNDYVIYPNPITESFQINGIDEVVTIRIIDVSGRIMLSKQLVGNEQIFVSFLPKGLYIVKIYTNKGGIERKLVKK